MFKTGSKTKPENYWPIIIISVCCKAKVFSNTLIFCCKNLSSFCDAATRIFLNKNINVFIIFQDRNFNDTLADEFVII